MSSSSVLILVCIWHAIVVRIQTSYGASVAARADVAVLIALGSLYFLTHVIIGLWISTRVSRRFIRNASALGLLSDILVWQIQKQ